MFLFLSQKYYIYDIKIIGYRIKSLALTNRQKSLAFSFLIKYIKLSTYIAISFDLHLSIMQKEK